MKIVDLAGHGVICWVMNKLKRMRQGVMSSRVQLSYIHRKEREREEEREGGRKGES
jgi:hypothetical protein